MDKEDTLHYFDCDGNECLYGSCAKDLPPNPNTGYYRCSCRPGFFGDGLIIQSNCTDCISAYEYDSPDKILKKHSVGKEFEVCDHM
eukprot:Pgem_evm1s734